MDKLKYIKLKNEDGSYTDSIPLAVDSDYVDVGNTSLTTALNNLATKAEVEAIASGGPAGTYDTVTSLITDDPDHSKIYVVLENGKWYYYNNNTFVAGGDYISNSVELIKAINEKCPSSSFENFLKYNNISAFTTKNLYNYQTTERNKRLRTSGSNIGKTYDYEGKWVTDFIPVEPGDLLFASVNGVATTFNAFCTYDINKQCIEYIQYFSQTGGTQIGSNVKYIRVEVNNSIVAYNGKVQIEKDEITSFLPYGIWYNDNDSRLINIISTKLDSSIFDNYLDYNNIEKIVSSNMYNYMTTENNKRLHSSGTDIGKTYDATGRWVSDFIEVDEGDVIRTGVNGVIVNFNGYCTYDAEKKCLNYITYTEPEGQGGIVIPSNVKYIRIENNTSIAAYNDKIQIEKNEISSPYKPYGEWFQEKKEYKTVTIKPVNGDYTSLRTAFETEGENTIYYIYEGMYKVDDDFTEEEIINASYSSSGTGFVGLRVPNNSKIIGIGDKTKIIIKTDISTDYSFNARYNIATLNLFGNCELNNLTILAINTRTPVHDDFKAAQDSTHKIINCILRNETQVRTSSHGYGLGLRSGETVIIEDCNIYPTMICHSNVGFTKEASCLLKNTTVSSVLGIQDLDSSKSVYITLDNVSYGILSYSKTDVAANAYMIINNLSYNEIPMLLKHSNMNINGYNIREQVAHSTISAGQLVAFSTDSHGIFKIRTTAKQEDMIGIALNDGNIGDIIKYYVVNKYLTTTLCGIENFNLYDEVVINDNRQISIGSENPIGKIIAIYENMGIIKLY